MTHNGGGARRRVTHGTTSTRAALAISPSTPTWAIHPAARPRSTELDATTTTAMPEICTIVISGIAAKLTISPANVRREKTNALTGSSAISAHTEAISSAAGARSHADIGMTSA